ncbi:cobyric acid synthase [Thermodesulfovibrio yellowstonii]|uniref:Cobyric acid synthase n=1 Tax=Thermodesulfovibrio yellowstonii TaxID=28262 RepID=A0A9W6GGW3_9BACT|nr:cobyric acid synthase [Thermodesulfovibrio islandicus]GLI53737.1 cobyric acid synthase [Thermodesulfovibrio islandicus]
MAKLLMIQGTSSNCGKSLIVNALCRIAKNRGIKVAPFKAQNMSLQSFVTEDGGEIGLAQAIQAEAAGVVPNVHMNPVLLKPSGQQGIQIVVQGKLYKTLNSQEFHRENKKLWDVVKYSIDCLLKKHDFLIIEGAGSPAEINLLDRDIVNMAVAEYLKAPVILVGDIDRGGVFASLYGTVKLLEKYDNLFKGFIINKFRGYVEILLPGIKKLEELINKPCLGVVPYLGETGISDEDGVSMTLTNFVTQKVDAPIKIVVVRLRYISNFNDFEPLRFEPDIELIYSLRKEDLLTADIIIIPGSKKTFEDLKLLKELKIDETLRKLAKNGVEIIGICGGLQMLGEKLVDPYMVESSLREFDGIGLLPVETVFYPEKITTQVEGYLCSEPSIKITGYEIHKGITHGPLGLFKITRTSIKQILFDGIVCENVWGTYIHGVFESDSLRRWLINRHRVKKGLSPIDYSFSWKKLKESFIDNLANTIEKNLNINRVWEIAGL